MTVRSSIGFLALLVLLGAGVTFFQRDSPIPQGGAVEPPGVGPSQGRGLIPEVDVVLPDRPDPEDAQARPDQGRAEDGVGERSAQAPPPEESGGDLIVRVIDEGGAPIVGVTITLGGIPGTEPIAQQDTQAGGEAIFPGNAVQAVQGAVSKGQDIRATVEALGSLDTSGKIDQQVLANGELELVVARHGQVRVILSDVKGGPFVGPASVQLGLVRDDEPVTSGLFSSARESSVSKSLEEGEEFLFPIVELGGLLELQVTRPGIKIRTRMHVEGPTVAGHTLEIPMTWGSDHPVLEFRVIDDAGQPLIGTDLTVEIATHFLGYWDEHSKTMRTSEEGMLQVDLGDNWAEGTERRLELLLMQGGAPGPGVAELRARVDLSQDFGTGLTVLNDVVLTSPPIFVGGRVVDGIGAALANAKLILEVFDAERWARLHTFELSSEPDGSFRAFGFKEGKLFRLTAERQGLIGTTVEFLPGRDDLLLELHEGGSLAGRVLLGEGLSADLVRIEVRPVWDQENPPNPIPKPSRKDPSLDGSFRLEGLVPGIYSVHVLPSRGWHKLWSENGFEVQSGVELGDPRLNPIDLQGLLHKHMVTIQFPEGSDAVGGELQFGPTGAESLPNRTWFNAYEEISILGAARIDLSVAISGFRTEHALGVAGEIELKLRLAPRVRLRIDGDYAPPESPFFVRPVLIPVGYDNFGSFDWDSPALDSRREVVISAPEAGLCEVRWLIQRQGDGVGIGSVAGSLGHRVQVLDSPKEQAASIVLTQEQLDELLRQLN